MAIARQPGEQAAGGEESGSAETSPDQPSTITQGNDGCDDPVHPELDGVPDPDPSELTIVKRARATAQQVATSGQFAHVRQIQQEQAALFRSMTDRVRGVESVTLGIQRSLGAALAPVERALGTLPLIRVPSGVAPNIQIPGVGSGTEAVRGQIDVWRQTARVLEADPTAIVRRVFELIQRDHDALLMSLRRGLRDPESHLARLRLLGATPISPEWGSDLWKGLPRMELPPWLGVDFQELLRRTHRQARLRELADAHADGDIDKVEAIREELGLTRAEIRGFVRRHQLRAERDAREQTESQLARRDEALKMLFRGEAPDEIARVTGVSREWVAELHRTLMEGVFGRIELAVVASVSGDRETSRARHRRDEQGGDEVEVGCYDNGLGLSGFGESFLAVGSWAAQLGRLMQNAGRRFDTLEEWGTPEDRRRATQAPEPKWTPEAIRELRNHRLECPEQVDFVEKILRDETLPGGRSASIEDPRDRTRRRVKNGLRDLLRRMERDCPRLFAYVNSRLTVGNQFCGFDCKML